MKDINIVDSKEANVYMSKLVEKNRIKGENPTQTIVRLIEELWEVAAKLSAFATIYSSYPDDFPNICPDCGRTFETIFSFEYHRANCPVREYRELTEKLNVEGNSDAGIG